MGFNGDLRGVVEEVKEKAKTSIPQVICKHMSVPCHTSGKSNIDELISANGNFYLSFHYSNYGYNTLLLLPNYCIDDNEDDKNKAVIDMLDGLFEESLIIDEFIKEHPNTPFIIKEYCFDKCVETLKERLDILIVTGDGEKNYEKFINEYEKFDKLRKAAWNLARLEEERYYHDAVYNPLKWKKYIDFIIDDNSEPF